MKRYKIVHGVNGGWTVVAIGREGHALTREYFHYADAVRAMHRLPRKDRQMKRVRRNSRDTYYTDGFRNGAEAAKVNIAEDTGNLLKYAERDRLGEYAGEIREHQVQMAGDISYDVGRGVTERQYERWEDGFYRGFEATVKAWLKSRKNPLTAREARGILAGTKYATHSARKASPHSGLKQYMLGKVAGKAGVVLAHGPSATRKRALTVERAAGRMAVGMTGVRRVAPNRPKKSRVRRNAAPGHPIHEAGNAVHRFMGSLDNAHLGYWRDVPLRSVLIGGVDFASAYRSSGSTVQGRADRLVAALQKINRLRNYTTLLDTPLRAVAGAWGLMEMMRTDF